MRVCGVDRRHVFYARSAINGLVGITRRHGIAVCTPISRIGVGAHEGICQGAVGGVVGRIDSVAEVEGLADSDTILAVVNSPTIGEDVDIGAFGSELAIALCEVLAHRFRGGAEIVTEGTCGTSLASALSKEFTWYV